MQILAVLSEYRAGYHTGGDVSSPLASLCVPGRGQDCNLAVELIPTVEVLPARSWRVVTKAHVDAWTSPGLRAGILDFIARGGESLIVGGLTVTTCVRTSVLSILSEAGPALRRVIVPRDVVGARSTAFRPDTVGTSRVDRAYADMKAAGAVVIGSWRSLRWMTPSTMQRAVAKVSEPSAPIPDGSA